MKIYQFDYEEMTRQANTIKEAVIEGLEKEGLLKGSAKEISEHYVVFVHKRGWLGELFAKWFGDSNDSIFRVNFFKAI
jgi:hypothetical protein